MKQPEKVKNYFYQAEASFQASSFELEDIRKFRNACQRVVQSINKYDLPLKPLKSCVEKELLWLNDKLKTNRKKTRNQTV